MRPHLDDDHAAGTLHVCARCLLAYCAARNLDHSGRATMAAILAVDRPPVLHQILVVGSLMIAISSGPTADQRIRQPHDHKSVWVAAILAFPVPVLRHVPKGARGGLGAMLGSGLGACCR